MSLAGRIAVVTGGSRGIGLALASALREAGAKVITLSRTGKVAGQTDPADHHLTCDITDPAALEAAARRIGEVAGGAPDILVNNAGIFRLAPLSGMPAELFTDSIATNLHGPFLFVRALLPSMLERGEGHIVGIGSIADRQIFPGNGAYSAAKYGLRAMHEVLRIELRGTGVRVTLVSPGPVDTPIWDSVLEADKDGRFPARRDMLRPVDVVAAVMFALSCPADVNVDELRLSRS